LRPSEGGIVVAFLYPATAVRELAARAAAVRDGLIRSAGVLAALCLLTASIDARAASNKVRVTNLADMSFGTVADLQSDAIQNESVCLYADTATNGYNVTATGAGPAGAFQLSSGLSSVAYEVQWSSSSGQSAGADLKPNVPLTGQVSGASHQTCSNGPVTTASLIVLLRSTSLSSATAGTYSGTLTLVVGAE
jgi:hypothetical protein